MRARWSRRGLRAWSPTRQFDADALVAAAALLADQSALDRMRVASRAIGGRVRRGSPATCCSPWVSDRACPRRDQVERVIAGGRVTAARSPRRLTETEALAPWHGHPAPPGRQDVAPGAPGALHDDARRRARGPVRRGPQPVRAAGHRRGSRAPATCPLTLIGRGSDLVISDAGVGGLVVKSSPQQFRVEGSGSSPMPGCPWPRPRPSPRTRGCRVSSSGWPSRGPSAVRCGPMRVPMSRTSRASSSTPASSVLTAAKRCWTRGALACPTARASSSTHRQAGRMS